MADLFVKLSEHAREQMRQRNVSFDEVVEILQRPEVVTSTEDADRRKFFGGDLCLVVADEKNGRLTFHVVVTILWRKGDQWTSEEMSQR